MKAEIPSDQAPMTRDEAIIALRKLADELGHVPKKSELPEPIRNRIRPLFEKWCYALEASGLVIPSEKVQQKRRAKEEHRRQVAERQKKRDEKKKIREMKKKAAAPKRQG